MTHPAQQALRRLLDSHRARDEVIAKFKALDQSDVSGLLSSPSNSSAHKPIVSLWQACCIFSGVNFKHELALPYCVEIGWLHAPKHLGNRLRELSELYQIAKHEVETGRISVSKGEQVLLTEFTKRAVNQVSEAGDGDGNQTPMKARLDRYVRAHGEPQISRKNGGSKWRFKGMGDFAKAEKERKEKRCDPKSIREDLTDALAAREGATGQQNGIGLFQLSSLPTKKHKLR